MLNRDKGFVREGPEAQIKAETFDFTKYKVIDGAVSLGRNGGPQPGQGQAATVAAAGAGALVFPAHLALSPETVG
jgi:hypothetical protein